ncbi:hypothetical protein YYE_00613 [Plasmodium vinckei vinckei]|nr:hypothetical protein YYE_00613 [Plasmodium vinckei vinckei]
MHITPMIKLDKNNDSHYSNKYEKEKRMYILSPIIKLSLGKNEYVSPDELNIKTSGFLGYKCDFSTEGIHNLEPDIVERRSVICSVNSYFIYDKIKLIVPKQDDPNSKFKLLPENCFEKVYSDIEGQKEIPIEKTGLVEYTLEKNDTNKDYSERIIQISPFNNKDVEFYCICDNTEQVISHIDGRSALVHIRVLKYPHKIISVNLTDKMYPYLPDTYDKNSIVDYKLEVGLKEGELLVLACKQIDDKCFQKNDESKSGDLYKTNKLIYHKDFTLFKAPIYVKSNDATAECKCKINETNIYTITVKPEYDEKVIHGCNFSNDLSIRTFTNNMNLLKYNENTDINCNVEIDQPFYDHLIGISCPGTIIPDCFFQVYKPPNNELKSSEITYLDSQLNIGNIEYYEDAHGNNDVRIFSIVGAIPQSASFTCMCKMDKITGFMNIKIGSACYAFLSKLLIIFIPLLFMWL